MKQTYVYVPWSLYGLYHSSFCCQIKIERRFKSHQFKRKQHWKTKRGKLNGTTRFQMGTVVLHVQQYYWPCYDASNVHDMRSQLYTQLKLKSKELFIRGNLLKKHASHTCCAIGVSIGSFNLKISLYE